MFVALLLVSACKKKPLGREGTQEQADADYVTSVLSPVCDGAKVQEAKAYGASGPHPIVILHTIAHSNLAFNGRRDGFRAVVTPKTSLEQTELVGCVEYAGDGTSAGNAPSTARVVRARDGVEVARFDIGLRPRGERDGDQMVKAFDPYVRGEK